MANLDYATNQQLVPPFDWQPFADKILVDMSVIQPASADVIQFYNVGEGTFITRVSCMIVVAEGGAANIDIGDGDAVNGFDDAVDINAAAKVITRSLEATDAYGIGKYYSAADTLDIVVNSASVDTAKILIIVEGNYVSNATVQSTL